MPDNEAAATRTFVLIWILIWYLAVIYLVGVVLGVYQFQSSILLPDGKTDLIASLRQLAETDERHEKLLIELREKVAKQRMLKEGMERKKIQIESKVKALSAQLDDLEKRTVTPTTVEGKRDQDEAARVQDLRKRLVDAREEELSTKSATDYEAQIHGVLLRELEQADLDRENFRAQHESKLWALEQFRAVRSYVATFLIFLPPDILTLILTFALGFFGSTIHSTRAIFGSDPKKYPFSWYIFRPFQGAVMALCVFVLFKAGVLAFSTQNSPSGTPLNPFLIAVLAVLAGVFSEEAYDRLSRAAKRFFSSDEEEQTRSADTIGKKEETIGEVAQPAGAATATPKPAR